MGHWPGLEAYSFRGLRYAWHADGVGNQHQPLAKRVKSIVAGESVYSVVEETAFPALHGTLVEVGGHLSLRTEECAAHYKHKLSYSTTPQ